MVIYPGHVVFWPLLLQFVVVVGRSQLNRNTCFHYNLIFTRGTDHRHRCQTNGIISGKEITVNIYRYIAVPLLPLSANFVCH